MWWDYGGSAVYMRKSTDHLLGQKEALAITTDDSPMGWLFIDMWKKIRISAKFEILYCITTLIFEQMRIETFKGKREKKSTFSSV